jgi:hypothetical protein
MGAALAVKGSINEKYQGIRQLLMWSGQLSIRRTGQGFSILSLFTMPEVYGNCSRIEHYY